MLVHLDPVQVKLEAQGCSQSLRSHDEKYPVFAIFR